MPTMNLVCGNKSRYVGSASCVFSKSNGHLMPFLLLFLLLGRVVVVVVDDIDDDIDVDIDVDIVVDDDVSDRWYKSRTSCAGLL
jgi:hypothetical protein